ncbi:hypothetical protein OQA88_8719 [Cercophora sp. LCS_1]
MAKPQEARSLSDINYIAANPPQYPHHPELRESLTLYISRVPGTRDIILSTLKPQRKNVTGEDVTNSLYYVHYDLPTDELLAAPRRRPEAVTSPRSSGESARTTIPRKPLPASARVPKLENSFPDPPGRRPPYAESLDDPENTAPVAAPAAPTDRSTDAGPVAAAGPLPTPTDFEDPPPPLPPRPTADYAAADAARKPLGPRPLVATDHNNIPRGSMGRESPGTPTRTGVQFADSRVMSPSPTKTGQRPSVVPFSLTLIRRDPTTGGQWNIGKVASFQTNIPTPETADPNLNPADMGAISRPQKINVRLDTSGYAKYRGMPTLANVESFRPGSGHSFAQTIKGLASGTNQPVNKTVPSPPPEDGFNRQVVMSYAKTWTSNIKTKTKTAKNPFHRRDRASSSAAADEYSPEDLAAPRNPFRQRADSASTVGSADSATWKGEVPNSPSNGAEGRNSPPALTTEPGPGLRPKGFTFISPWDGRCEFRTSTNGRSLKCRHILDPKSPKFNPVAVAQSIRDAQTMGRSRADELTSALAGAKPVSELRFNLPSGDLFQSKKAEGEKGKWDPHALHGQFSRFLQHLDKGSSSDEWDEDDGMDLSLGREDAGGGNRGKRAKLGKLIIHDEGLKMLDLVVAANVGVWWTTWEKVDS